MGPSSRFIHATHLKFNIIAQNLRIFRNPMRKKNDITLGEALEKMVSEFNLGTKLDESRIKDAWVKVMGKPIAKYTSSVSFRDGKLYIKIDSASLKQELGYSRDKIKDLFNKELGATVVHDVVVF